MVPRPVSVSPQWSTWIQPLCLISPYDFATGHATSTATLAAASTWCRSDPGRRVFPSCGTEELTVMVLTVQVRDVRRLHPSDPQSRGDYPLHLYDKMSRQQRCNLCAHSSAEKVNHDNSSQHMQCVLSMCCCNAPRHLTNCLLPPPGDIR